MNKGFAIAIDGPVASGKGTLAPNLAKKLNGFYLDTGAMYRCVALYTLNNNIDVADQNKIESATKDLEIDFSNGKTFLNDQDVSEQIRSEEVSRIVPVVAKFPGVRRELISKQQKIAKRTLRDGKIFIAEGRDIATVVLPNAEFKLYLTADPSERAKRRRDQLEGLGADEELEIVLNDLNERDRNDMEVNKTLVKNPKDYGYEILDNSNMSEEQTLEEAIKLLKKKGLYD